MPGPNGSEELSLAVRKSSRTIIYDCAVNLRMLIPRDIDNEDMNNNWIYRITLLAMAYQFCSKHPNGSEMMNAIYLILKKTTAATKRDFRIVRGSHGTRLIFEKKERDCGHFLERDQAVPPFYETIKYTGEVDDDYRGRGSLMIACDVKLFLGPGVQAGADFYRSHGFPVVTYRDKDFEDPNSIIEWCGGDLEAPFYKSYDVGERWGWLAGGFVENQEYYKDKRKRINGAERYLSDDDNDSGENVALLI